MKSPAAIVCHLTEHMPAAWTVAEMPRGMRRRDGVPVDVDDCPPHGPGVQCHACAAEE